MGFLSLLDDFKNIVGGASKVPKVSPLAEEFKSLVDTHAAAKPPPLTPNVALSPKIQPPPALAQAFAAAKAKAAQPKPSNTISFAQALQNAQQALKSKPPPPVQSGGVALEQMLETLHQQTKAQPSFTPTVPIEAAPSYAPKYKQSKWENFWPEGLAPSGMKTDLPLEPLAQSKRAKEIGFWVEPKSGPEGIGGDWYHGSGKMFDEFSLGQSKTEKAIFLTRDPNIAHKYSWTNTYPLWTRAQNIKTVDLGGQSYSHLGFTKAVNQARKDGYDAVLFKNVVDLGGKQDQLAVLKPEMLRSKFAVFDPAKKQSAKLAAGVAGGAVLAGAAGLGADKAAAAGVDEFQTINVEGYGPVRFPTSMTPDEIGKAIRDNIAAGTLQKQGGPPGAGSVVRSQPQGLPDIHSAAKPYQEPGLRDPGQAEALAHEWEQNLLAGRGLTGQEPGPAGGVAAAAGRFLPALRETFTENVQAGAKATAGRAKQAAEFGETPAYERGGEPFDEFMKIVGSPRQAAARAYAGGKSPGLELAAALVPLGAPLGGIMAAGQLRKAVAAGKAVKTGPGAKFVERTADDLFRLRGGATADRAEIQGLVREFNKAEPQYAQAGVQEEIYRALENNVALPPDKQAVVDKFIQPLRDEAFQLYARAQANAGRKVDLADLDPTYMHRQAKGHWAAYDEPGTNVDPVMGVGVGKSLGRATASMQAPKYVTLHEPNTGGRMVVSDLGDGTLQMWHKGAAHPQIVPFTGELKPGSQVHISASNKTFDVKRSLTDELELSTPTRYHKNAFVNTADNLVRLRSVVRNQEFLQQLKQSPEAIKWMTSDAKVAAKQGWKESKVPQLKGTFMHDKLRHVLDDFVKPGIGGDEYLDGLRRANQATTSLIFWNPTPHLENVWGHWVVGRGFDWLRPSGYYSIAKDGLKAMREVTTMGPKYQQLLREGSGLIHGGVQNADFYRTIGQKMGMEIERDPQRWGQIAKSLGLNTPLDLAKSVYDASRYALWWGNDVFMMQRVMELERKGMSTHKAIREAEKHIPNYRIPTEVLGSRGLSAFMQDPAFTMFNRYHYGMIKSYANMVNDLVRGKTGQERIEAVGNLMALGLFSFALYPTVDKAVQAVTGNKDITKIPRGPAAIPTGIKKAVEGDSGEFQKVISNLVIPSPPLRTGVETIFNKELWSGRSIREPGAPAAEQAVQAGEHALKGLVSPYSLLSQATAPGGHGAMATARNQLLGLREPSEGMQRYEAKRSKYEHRAVTRRRQKPRGPIEGAYQRLNP